ncbi:MAG: hypothetical protein RRY64_08595, partial [Oscillospiraceae bacterium]
MTNPLRDLQREPPLGLCPRCQREVYRGERSCHCRPLGRLTDNIKEDKKEKHDPKRTIQKLPRFGGTSA